ncbi:MAG: MFS transporter [Bdellovibrionaceae bacterium]|nr:MFS transporter [Pseudobdellovibrionaceae bacterium]
MSSSNRKTQLVLIFLTVFIYLLGFGIIIPILPILSRDFGATATETGLLMSIYSLMQFLFSPFWGRLSDRIGRKPILLACLLGEAASYILFAMSRDLTTLFVARMLAGFFGGSISTASAYISDITPSDQRSKGMALIGAAFGLGFVFGPAIGGLLTEYSKHLSTEPFFNTSFASYVVSGLCFFTFLFGMVFLKESLTAKAEKRDFKNRFLIIFEKLQIPIVGHLTIAFFLLSFSMSAMEATLVLYMGDVFAWGIKEVSYGFAYIGVVIVFTQGYLIRRVLPRWGERLTLKLGTLAFFLGMILIVMAPNITVMAIAMTLVALGNGMSNPSILGSISNLTPNTEQGSTLGVTQSLSSLGRILGPALGGFVFHHLFIQSPFVLAGLLGFIAFLIVIMLNTRIPNKGKTIGTH